MASLVFTGNLIGRHLTDTTQDMRLDAVSGKNVIIKLGDSSGSSRLELDNSTGNAVTSFNSIGDATVNTVSAVGLNYAANVSAGSYAATKTTIPAALDALFPGSNQVWNETSPQAPDGVRTVFETISRKTFLSNKIMVFKGGMKQHPGGDYFEDPTHYSITFVQAPISGILIEFTYIVG